MAQKYHWQMLEGDQSMDSYQYLAATVSWQVLGDE